MNWIAPPLISRNTVRSRVAMNSRLMFVALVQSGIALTAIEAVLYREGPAEWSDPETVATLAMLVFLVAHVGERKTAKVNRILFLGLGRGLLGFGDHALNERAQCLGLGQRGLNATVIDERRGEIGQHRPTVLASHAQGGVVFIVTHGVL